MTRPPSPRSGSGHVSETRRHRSARPMNSPTCASLPTVRRHRFSLATKHLVANEKRWRRTVGKEAQVGEFIGRADRWRRVSETWPDPDLGDGGLVIELAMRLTDYI